MDESPYRKSKRIEYQIDSTATYLLGKCEQLCADYARSQGISETELTQRVGQLLLAQAGGQALGAQDRMPALRGALPQNGQALAALALDERSHSGAQQIALQEFDNLSQQQLAAALYAQGLDLDHIAQRLNVKRATIRTYLAREGVKYDMRKPGRHSYNGTHWTQQKKNRAKLMRVLRHAQSKRKNGGS